MTRRRTTLVAWVLTGCVTGCAFTPPYIGQGPHPQISRGHPNVLIDTVGNMFALPAKLLFWNRRIFNHMVGETTEQYVVAYIDSPLSKADNTHFSINEYAPGRALARLAKNRNVAWPYRLLLGLPTTLLADILIPRRLFAGLLGSDYYNPFNDIVYLYSDIPSVALHEAGHVHDFNTRRFKGTYAAVRMIPLVDLYQEMQATEEALYYWIETGERDREYEAYHVLYPALGSYVGGYFLAPLGGFVGILGGHLVGRTTAHKKRNFYRELDANANRRAPVTEPAQSEAVTQEGQ